jgi:succinyl-CoA synthetase alpha subunit
MSSQSGALGLAILALAAERQLGISTFVSVGNKADVSGNDLLQYWEVDDGTDVILLYLESFGNPRRFARIARRVSRVKPIIAVKAGRMLADVAPQARTAALAAKTTSQLRCSARPASYALKRSTKCSTSRRLWRISRCRRGAASVSSRMPGGILCTDAWQSGLLVPELSEQIKSN